MERLQDSDVEPQAILLKDWAMNGLYCVSVHPVEDGVRCQLAQMIRIEEHRRNIPNSPYSVRKDGPVEADIEILAHLQWPHLVDQVVQKHGTSQKTTEELMRKKYLRVKFGAATRAVKKIKKM
jgi:hypothetical protein